MAGDWIKWCKGLCLKREVVMLASKLGRDRHEIASRLMMLWEWCDDNIPESDFDAEGCATIILGENALPFLDSLCGLPGMAEAMASPEVRWLMLPRSDGRFVFPNLGRHNGRTAKTRALDNRKKKRNRTLDDPSLSDRDKCPDEIGTKSGPDNNSSLLDSSDSSKRKKFVIPTIDSVRAYCAERGNSIDPEHFVDYHVARGWKLKSGQPMVDWKATIRTWEKNQSDRHESGPVLSAKTKNTIRAAESFAQQRQTEESDAVQK